MVGTITSYDVNLFNSTYDNIRLTADKIWEYNHEDTYRKLNRSLWIKISKLSRNQNRRRQLVSDVIPESRLSKYGNYRYDDERECLYVRDVERSVSEEASSSSYDLSKEPWLHPDVKEYFTRLKSKALPSSEALSDDSSSNSGCIDEEYKKHCRLPYTINSVGELQLKLRISSDKVIDLWRKHSTEELISYGNNREQRTEQTYHPKQRGIGSQVLCNVETHTIVISKNRYRERDCKCSAKASVPPVPILSAEVPEFFPKGPRLEAQYESVPLQYFPSIPERIYNRAPLPNVSAIFQNPAIPLLATPIMTPLIRSPQWLPRIAPPLQIQVPMCTLAPQTFTTVQSICPIINRPIQLHEKIIQPNPLNSSPMPVYQRPLEYFPESRRKSQRVDFKNLILLTKSGMKARRNQSNHSNSCNPSLEPGRNNLATDNPLQFADRRIYPNQPKHFITSTSATPDLQNSECLLDVINVCESNSLEVDNDD
ncbi:uncharacterized protein [Fopius arisanus]|uniref:Uncharacterized protein n=1 Tax=Fopius arisanus TaxID=64838 RepID=A0A9R1TRN0_9HYME|nr:PREDICTED: uncharacterized protein LOC105273532 [Fopius arisanus]